LLGPTVTVCGDGNVGPPPPPEPPPLHAWPMLYVTEPVGPAGGKTAVSVAWSVTETLTPTVGEGMMLVVTSGDTGGCHRTVLGTIAKLDEPGGIHARSIPDPPPQVS